MEGLTTFLIISVIFDFVILLTFSGIMDDATEKEAEEEVSTPEEDLVPSYDDREDEFLNLSTIATTTTFAIFFWISGRGVTSSTLEAEGEPGKL